MRTEPVAVRATDATTLLRCMSERRGRIGLKGNEVGERYISMLSKAAWRGRYSSLYRRGCGAAQHNQQSRVSFNLFECLSKQAETFLFTQHTRGLVSLKLFVAPL